VIYEAVCSILGGGNRIKIPLISRLALLVVDFGISPTINHMTLKPVTNTTWTAAKAVVAAKTSARLPWTITVMTNEKTKLIAVMTARRIIVLFRK
jgi:hypothetical protein